MERYGSDKPDRRFGAELVELTDYFAETPFRVFQADYVGAVVMPGGATQPRKQLDAWQEFAKQRGPAASPTCWSGGRRARRPVAKNLSEAERAGVAAAAAPRPATASSSPPGRGRRRRACSGPPGWRSAVAAACSTTVGLGLLLGGGRTAVRAGRRGGPRPATSRSARCLDRGAPRLHLARTGDLRPRPGHGAGLGVRPGLQRQRDRRRLDPYPPRATSRSGCSR